jgi:hypothetical protein
MKPPKPELQNTRIIHLATRFILLPFVFAAAVYGWAKGRVQGSKSDKRLRAEDELRQSRARRKLRGLPPDHVHGSPRPL